MPPKISKCRDLGDQLRRGVDAFYDRLINPIDVQIKEITAAGGNPGAFKPNPAVTIDLPKLKESWIAARQEAHKGPNAKQKECEDGAVPDWVDDANKVLNVAIIMAVLPIVLILKDFKDYNVDLNEVYQGKLFGGDDAIIPKARDDILRELHIGGDAAQILRDPVNEVLVKPAEAVVDAVKEGLGRVGIRI